MEDPSRATFDDPLNIEALEWYANLYHQYHVAPTPAEVLSIGGPEAAPEMDGSLDGRVGMWGEEFYHLGGRIRPVKWPMRWGMVTVPRSTTDIGGDIYVTGLAISSQTRYPDAAWQWVSFVSQQILDYFVPARRSLAESSGYEQLVGENVAAVARAVLKKGLAYSSEVFSRFRGVFGIFGEAVNGIIAGDRTPQEAMDWAQQEAEVRQKL